MAVICEYERKVRIHRNGLANLTIPAEFRKRFKPDQLVRVIITQPVPDEKPKKEDAHGEKKR